MVNKNEIMKIEIWSDLVCPFCYIGKRRFEEALKKFPAKDKIKIEWKSFLLDPHSKPIDGKSIHEALAAKKGWTIEQAKRIGEWANKAYTLAAWLHTQSTCFSFWKIVSCNYAPFCTCKYLS